jgi:hypothetical protein
MLPLANTNHHLLDIHLSMPRNYIEDAEIKADIDDIRVCIITSAETYGRCGKILINL